MLSVIMIAYIAVFFCTISSIMRLTSLSVYSMSYKFSLVGHILLVCYCWYMRSNPIIIPSMMMNIIYVIMSTLGYLKWKNKNN